MSLDSRLIVDFAASHPVDAARLLGDQRPEETAALVASLPEDVAAPVIAAMAPVAGAECLRLVPAQAGAKILARLPADIAVTLLRRIPGEVREGLFAHLPDAGRLRPLLAFARDTAGALMDAQALALPQDLGLHEARRRVARFAPYLALELFVVDRDQRLLGLVLLRDILDLSRRGALVGSLQRVDPLRAWTDTEAMSLHPGWSEYDSLPVVDERGRYLGAVRHARLRRLAAGALDKRRAASGRVAVRALGELYWLGLGGLFSGAPRPTTRRDPEDAS